MTKRNNEIMSINLEEIDIETLEARLELAATAEAACDCNGTGGNCPNNKCQLVIK